MLRIFDLDGTVIDSSHRQLTRPDGTLNLDHWKENCTPAKIFNDKLLPLARILRQQIREGAPVIICTARVFSDADWQYLENHGILASCVLTRGHNDTRGDGEYKIGKLSAIASPDELRNAVMFDDASKVRAALRQTFGMRVIDPVPLNKKLG